MEQRLFFRSCQSHAQEIPYLLHNPQVHCRVHKGRHWSLSRSSLLTLWHSQTCLVWNPVHRRPQTGNHQLHNSYTHRAIMNTITQAVWRAYRPRGRYNETDNTRSTSSRTIQQHPSHPGHRKSWANKSETRELKRRLDEWTAITGITLGH